jgi:hypothetical protein
MSRRGSAGWNAAPSPWATSMAAGEDGCGGGGWANFSVCGCGLWSL